MPGMQNADKDAQAYALAAELGVAFGARKATLEFERRFSASDQGDRLNREMFQIRVAEARLKGALADPVAGVAALAALAAAAAEDLEAEAKELEPLLSAEAAGRRIGLLRLVCGLVRLARYGDGRSRARFTAAREGRHLPGFEDALELAPENELFFLALRRFEDLLQTGKAWDLKDADWLRLRVASAPGRLRLHAAALRSAAEAAAGFSLPPALAEARAPFLSLGFEPGAALAWAVAGFSPKEALAWGEAGLPQAELAQAWRDRDLSPDEAATWVQADLMADEAAAFKACGASDPATAHQLRHALGDVEHLLAWHRAGYEVAEVLKLRHQGVRRPPAGKRGKMTEDGAPSYSVSRSIPSARTAAVSPAKAPDSPPAFKISRGATLPGVDEAPMAPTVPPVIKITLGRVLVEGIEEAPAKVPAASKPAPTETGLKAPSRWAQDRAQARFGVDRSGVAEALSAQPAQGGGWMFWGAFDAKGKADEAGGWEQAASLPQGGGLADAVLESEKVLVPGQCLEPGSLEPGDTWQKSLDRLRGLRRAVALPGQWHLMGWEPQRISLFWGLMFEGEAPPWADAVDYDPKESWTHRWARKAEEWGEEGLACPCRVGRRPAGGWWVAWSESLQQSPKAGALAVEPRRPSPAWRSGMEEFCLKMEMGAHIPHWVLLCEEGEA